MNDNWLASYDRWRTRAPEDEPGYWDGEEPDETGCEVCDLEKEPAPSPPYYRCDDCGLCMTHCHGHTDDELAADQGLDDDIDF